MLIFYPEDSAGREKSRAPERTGTGGEARRKDLQNFTVVQATPDVLIAGALTHLALSANYLRLTGDVCLVAEVPHASKHHRQSKPVGCLNHLGISLRASWLDYGCGAGLRDFFDAIGERKESVGGYYRAL